MEHQRLRRVGSIALIGGLIAAALTAGVTAPAAADGLPDGTPFQWGSATLIQNQPQFTDAGPDANQSAPGKYGSQFPRLVKLSNGSWLIGYTIMDNNGYTHDPAGGTR